MTDIRLGRWQDVLADVERCDSLICDPPYSARTHDGFVSGSDESPHDGRGVAYQQISADDAGGFAASWDRVVGRWVVIFADHIAWAWHELAWSDLGWMTFAPVIAVRGDAPPRMCGDGPTSCCDHIMIARRRAKDCMDGSRPGWYLGHTPRNAGMVGSKGLNLMRALVRDYSRPGDLVVDPFAGSGTTALACAIEVRRCITSEQDPERYEIARKRLAAGYTVEMFE